MKKTIIVLSAVLLCGSALAASHMGAGWFTGAMGGINIFHSVKLSNRPTLSYSNPGWSAGAELGYKQGHWSASAQYTHMVGYYKNIVKHTTLASTGGHTRVDAGMANVYFDTNPLFHTIFVGFIGAGVGVAQVNFVLDRAQNYSKTAFAYQGTAGIATGLTKRLSGFIAYRFFGTTKVSYFNYGSKRPVLIHNIEIGFNYSLGSIEAA